MKKEFTPFGIYFNKLRKSNGQTLEEVSSFLGVSISYISAVIHGEREIPLSWRNKIIEIYGLPHDGIVELDNAISDTPCGHKIPICLVEESLTNMIVNLFPEGIDRDNALIDLRKRLDNLKNK